MSESGSRRLELKIWFPKYPIDFRDQLALQRCFYLNGVNGSVPGTSRGKHKLMGHVMVGLAGPELPVSQKYFGKTSPDGDVEATWAQAMRLTWSLPWKAWCAAVTNVLGILPRFKTPAAPEGGIERLFDVFNPAAYEPAEGFSSARHPPSVTWMKDVDPGTALSFLEWVNESPSVEEDPRGSKYGFGRACGDWALGALIACGAVGPEAPVPFRTTLWVHDAWWNKPGELNEPAWRLCEDGPYTHRIEILTPTLLDTAMSAQKGWSRDRNRG